MDKDSEKMEKIVSLCKRRGFVFPGSEIYGGMKGAWDLGPLGVALNNNIKQEWWKMFVNGREDMYGLDAAILMNEKVWEASGHTGAGFSDPMIPCDNCNSRFRVDHLISNFNHYKAVFDELGNVVEGVFGEIESSQIEVKDLHKEVKTLIQKVKAGSIPDNAKVSLIDAAQKILSETTEKVEGHEERLASVEPLIEQLKLSTKFLGAVAQTYLERYEKCSVCGKADWGVPEHFNLMFETQVGAEGNVKSYLRPETAQGIFVNFKNVLDSMSPKMPFGIAQVGKAFRNEIAPREFLFRVREFEQMEIEYFVKEENWQEEYDKLLNDIRAWHAHLGLSADNIKEVEVGGDELAHYSKRTIDFDYNYPGKGYDELAGFAYRTDHDLKNHMEASGTTMEYIEPDGSRFIPHVLEPSFGVGRAFMAVLAEAYTEDEMGGETRTYLKLPAHLAPYRVAVSPLLKNKPQLVEKAREVFTLLKGEFGNVAYDDNGNIGKRYRRQDEIGTPHCVVIDFDTLGEEAPEHKDTVTVRNRDTGEQERVAISELANYLMQA